MTEWHEIAGGIAALIAIGIFGAKTLYPYLKDKYRHYKNEQFIKNGDHAEFCKSFWKWIDDK